MIYYDRKLKYVARTLRKTMTDPERLLWSRIRRKQLKDRQFYRQKPVGNFIVDFYCPSAKIIVEVDGSQHAEPSARHKDAKRDYELARMGFRVLRYSNRDVVQNVDGIILDILCHL